MVSILYQSRLSFWPHCPVAAPAAARRYPSSINRGYRSGSVATIYRSPAPTSIHPLSIEAIVLANLGSTESFASASYPSSINRGYRSGMRSTSVATIYRSYPSSINRGYRSGSDWPPSPPTSSSYPSSINRGYRSGIGKATRRGWMRWYPSSINRGYRSGIVFVYLPVISMLVSILYQSRLSFWLKKLIT